MNSKDTVLKAHVLKDDWDNSLLIFHIFYIHFILNKRYVNSAYIMLMLFLTCRNGRFRKY